MKLLFKFIFWISCTSIQFNSAFALANSEIPPITAENIRWMIPADAWSEVDIYQLKKFVFISGTPDLKIYSNSDRQGKSQVLSIKSYSLKSCFKSSEQFETPLANYKCGYHYCDKGEYKNGPNAIFPILRENKNCNPKSIRVSNFNYLAKTVGERTNLYIPINSEKDLINGLLKFYLNGRESFIDLKDIENKEIILSKDSLWDSQWLALIEVRKTKKLPFLNYLIEYLLPCVKKKDRNCVQKFFFKEELAPTVGMSSLYQDFDTEGGKLQQEINDEVLEELEACLSYESLMPHFLSLRGKKYACIPHTSLLLEGDSEMERKLLKLERVTFPEAVRFQVSNKFIFLKR